MKVNIVDIGKDYSRYPAGRFAGDGPFSGERFREEVLLPCLRRGEMLQVCLDNTAGYGSSFLEEAFGGLIRQGIPQADVNRLLSFVTEDSALEAEINGYIDDEAQRRHA